MSWVLAEGRDRWHGLGVEGHDNRNSVGTQQGFKRGSIGNLVDSGGIPFLDPFFTKMGFLLWGVR